jgi:pilus assembly protein CpaC
MADGGGHGWRLIVDPGGADYRRPRRWRILITTSLLTAALLGEACTVQEQGAQRRRSATSRVPATDAILYDQEFWADGPSRLQLASTTDAALVSEPGGQPDASAGTVGGAEAGATGAYPSQPPNAGTGAVYAALATDDEYAGDDGGAHAYAAAPADPYGGRASPDATDGRAPDETAAADWPAGGAIEARQASIVSVSPSQAAPVTPPGRRPGETKFIRNFPGSLQVPAGRSILLRLSRPAERVAISDPEVAEVVVISPYEVLVNGKGRRIKLQTGEIIIKEAETSVIVWDRQGRSDMRTLYINRARVEQILLEVTVAELNRSALEAYGFDFTLFNDGNLILSTPAKLFGMDELQELLPGANVFTGQLGLSPERQTFFYRNFDENFGAFLELLQAESLAKILARPVVVARSGEEAHFRVGGEVPVVYATANVATITFKEFGVLLTFTPAFTDDGMIDLKVEMEVSEPTTAFASSLTGGFDIPSFVGRQASTRVRLVEGENLLIGGLYREQVTETERKVPYLGDVPYLGYFFRQTRSDINRTELVMAVKPRVAQQAERLKVGALPTDRPPLSRGEVRTQPNPYGVTRPRIFHQPLPPPKPGRPSVTKEYLREGFPDTGR